MPVLFTEDQKFDEDAIRTGLMSKLLDMERKMMETITLIDNHGSKVRIRANWIALCTFAQEFRENPIIVKKYGQNLSAELRGNYMTRPVYKALHPRTLRIFAYMYSEASHVEFFVDEESRRQIGGKKQENKVTFYGDKLPPKSAWGEGSVNNNKSIRPPLLNKRSSCWLSKYTQPRQRIRHSLSDQRRASSGT